MLVADTPAVPLLWSWRRVCCAFAGRDQAILDCGSKLHVSQWVIGTVSTFALPLYRGSYFLLNSHEFPHFQQPQWGRSAIHMVCREWVLKQREHLQRMCLKNNSNTPTFPLPHLAPTTKEVYNCNDCKCVPENSLAGGWGSSCLSFMAIFFFSPAVLYCSHWCPLVLCEDSVFTDKVQVKTRTKIKASTARLPPS